MREKSGNIFTFPGHSPKRKGVAEKPIWTERRKNRKGTRRGSSSRSCNLIAESDDADLKSVTSASICTRPRSNLGSSEKRYRRRRQPRALKCSLKPKSSSARRSLRPCFRLGVIHRSTGAIGQEAQPAAGRRARKAIETIRLNPSTFR